MTERASHGLVVLVGAGPGDPRLISLAGADWLRRAEVVVYDRLVNPTLLAMARTDAEMIYVGKSRDGNAMDQKQINDLLVDRATSARLVVRLKGGDPYIFGRGGEEAAALTVAGVPYRVVPGVTAAAGAAAYAGIPLTDRRFASSLALVTGREDSTRNETRLDYAALAGVDTLVFYMGVANLPEIASQLIQAGRSGDTPAALVENATRPSQRVVSATLTTIADEATRQNVKPPALLIVGEVVTLRDIIGSPARGPLAGQTILVTRSRQQASKLSAGLIELGAEVIEAPTIEIAPPADWTDVDAALSRLDRCDLVCFTSPNGVEAFCGRAMELGLDARTLGLAQLAAVGPATAEALAGRFLRANIVPEKYTAESLAEALRTLPDLRKRRILLARADIARPELVEALRETGAAVDEITVYRTVRPTSLPPWAAAALEQQRVDWITFTSSSTVDNFVAIAGREALDGVKLASIGPVTSETLRSHDLAASAEASPHDIPHLVEAIARAAHGGAE